MSATELEQLEILIKKHVYEAVAGLQVGEKAVVNTIKVLETKSFWSGWQLKAGLVVLLVLGVYWFTSQYGEFQKQLALAEVAEKHAAEVIKIAEDTSKATELMKTSLLEELAKSQEALRAATGRQLVISKKITATNTAADTRIAEIIQPGRAIEVIKRDVQDNLQLNPEILNDGLIFTPQQAQALVALKINSDRLESNIKSVQEQLSIEQNKTKELSSNLAQAIAALNQSTKNIADLSSALVASQNAMDAYKKASKKTKWQIFKDVGKQVAITAVTAIIAGAVAHR